MKLISVTEKLLQEAWSTACKNLLEHRSGMQSTKIEIDLSKLLTTTKKVNRPTIAITGDAFLKIQALVGCTKDEIGWHGTVTQISPLKYVIEDIMCYPQIVTSATANTDEEEYTKWNMALSDEQVQSMRFQGHSHVNMSVSPSGVDFKYYDDILKLLPKNDFYIFAIFNKRNESTFLLYDLNTNIIYENTDMDIIVVNEKGVAYNAWAEENAEKYVTKKIITASPAFPYSAYQQHTLYDDDLPYPYPTTATSSYRKKPVTKPKPKAKPKPKGGKI